MKLSVKLLTAIVSVSLLFSSCSKPKDFSENYLRGKIDGILFECNANIRANKPEPIPGQGNDPNINIIGDWPGFSIHLFISGEGSGITTGSYVFEAYKDRSATLHEDNANSNFYYAGNGGTFDPVLLHGSGKITILYINQKYVKGNFEFVTDVNGATGISKTVVDGEFYIKRGS